MEVGERSLSARRRRRPAPPPPGPGILRIQVNHRSVCWDTTTSGTAPAHPNAAVTVRPSASGPARTGTADANGLVEITNLPAGSYRVEATAPNYRSASSTETVNPGATTNVTLEIQLNSGLGVICSRPHTARPSNPPTVSSEPPMFWHSAFMIWIREVAWLLFLALMVVFTIITVVELALTGTINPLLGGFCLPALCFGIVAYLTTIIFGEIPGYVTLTLAGLGWLALVVLNIMMLAGVGLPPLSVNIAWFPPLCAMWLVFFLGLIIGRQTYTVFNLGIPVGLMFVGLAIALVMYFVLVYVLQPAFWANPLEAAGVTIMVILASAVASLIGGLSGHVFVNDGNLETFTPHGTQMSLPYAGERYCVQGNRGWFSHYNSQVYCYDFAVPEGTHVLAIEEGHVIKFREDKSGSEFDVPSNPTANFIHVQHRDGTTAHYLHLKPGGVTAVNTVLVSNSTRTAAGRFDSDVHVHAGQVLAEAGSTGQSRFPHIHLGLYNGATGVGFVFKDADVQRHGGRSYTFRKYLSENPDHGPITV
jgi:hypothetical protein